MVPQKPNSEKIKMVLGIKPKAERKEIKKEKQLKLEKQEKLEEEQRQKELTLRKKLANASKKVMLFPGSKKEFEDFIGYETEWINSGGKNLGLDYNPRPDRSFGPGSHFDRYNINFQEKIIDSGIVALVDVNFSFTNHNSYTFGSSHYYGMPVRRKQK